MTELKVRVAGTLKSARAGVVGATTGPSWLSAPPSGGGGSTAPDPTLLPFADTSPWRLAVATGATFAAAGDSRNVAIANNGVNGDGQVWVNDYDHSHAITYASAGDPLATMTDTSHTSPTGIPAGGSWQERIPATAKIADGSDRHMHLITPDRTKVQEHFYVQKQSDTAYTCARRHEVPLTGSGLGPQNGTRAYGGSAIGGLIRSWEVNAGHASYTGAIKHPLAIALRNSQLYYNGVSEPDEGFGDAYGTDGYGLKRGYVWPATEQDWDSSSNYSGVIPMGSYFAIPGTVDLTTLGLVTTQGMMLAKAAQDFGVYITDRSGSTSFYVENDTTGPGSVFAAALRDSGGQYQCNDPRKVLAALRLVTNNAPATPNGGAVGAARRA